MTGKVPHFKPVLVILKTVKEEDDLHIIACPSPLLPQDGKLHRGQLDIITNRKQEQKGLHRQSIAFESLRLPFLVC